MAKKPAEGTYVTREQLAAVPLYELLRSQLPPESLVRLAKLPPDVKYPDHLKDKISYNKRERCLIFGGVMSRGEMDELLELSEDKLYRTAIKTLFKRSKTKVNRLELEMRERKWNLSYKGILIKAAPFISILALGIGFLVQWQMHTKQAELQTRQQMVETERKRQDSITQLKRELGDENIAISRAAARALTSYPEEAIPVLITTLRVDDLGLVLSAQRSLRHIGKDAIVPLANELRWIQFETTAPFSPLMPEGIPELEGVKLPDTGAVWSLTREYPLETLWTMPLEELRNVIVEASPDATDDEIDLAFSEFEELRTKIPRAPEVIRNVITTLAQLLRHEHMKQAPLWGIDLSGASLAFSDLSGANLVYANLSDSRLSSSNLSKANLAGANLGNTNLAGTNLEGANLYSANLVRVKHFRRVKSFKGTNLKGVKGLSKEDLEYAKSKGATIN